MSLIVNVLVFVAYLISQFVIIRVDFRAGVVMRGLARALLSILADGGDGDRFERCLA